MNGKKVLSIAWNELTNDNRVFNQAHSLKAKGYDVTVVGYKINQDLPKNEEKDGIIIRRINIEYSHDNWKRIPYSRNIWRGIQIPILMFFIAFRNFDVIHCHDLNTLQYGVRIKRLKGKRLKLIYDAHEYETERNGLSGREKRKAQKKEKSLIRFCDQVITVSPTIADEYVRLYGIEKPTVILNCPILRSKEVVKTNLFREIFGIANSTKILLYQGGMSYGRGIDLILETFDRFSFKNVAFVFLGDGVLTNKIKKHKKYGESVFYHPSVSGDVLLAYTSSADIGVSFGEDICLSHRYSLPNKLFEFIAAGLPVISSKGLLDSKLLIHKYQIGLTADNDDVEGFAKIVNNLSDLEIPNLKSNILKARSLFNWDTQEKKLIDLYDKL